MSVHVWPPLDVQWMNAPLVGESLPDSLTAQQWFGLDGKQSMPLNWTHTTVANTFTSALAHNIKHTQTR